MLEIAATLRVGNFGRQNKRGCMLLQTKASHTVVVRGFGFWYGGGWWKPITRNREANNMEKVPTKAVTRMAAFIASFWTLARRRDGLGLDSVEKMLTALNARHPALVPDTRKFVDRTWCAIYGSAFRERDESMGMIRLSRRARKRALRVLRYLKHRDRELYDEIRNELESVA